MVSQYLTYRQQRAAVLPARVDGVVVAVAAHHVAVRLVVVYPGVVGVDGTEVRPLLQPAEAVLARGRDEVPEGLVVGLVPLQPAPPAQGAGQGEVFTVRGAALVLPVTT